MTRFFQELWMILVESSVWLIVGFAIAGAIHALIPREWMLRHLSGRGFWPIAKASMLGIPLPLCSCSVIPVAAGLRSQGASKGASAAFAISTPQTGEESIPITWALFGPVYAFTRPVVAVITGLLAGILIDLTDRRDASEPEPKPEPTSDPGAISLSITNADDAGKAVESVEARATPAGSCCSAPKPEPASSCCSGSTPEPAASCCASTQPPTQSTLAQKFRSGLTHGFKTMPIDLAVWLSIGLLLAAAIGAFVPESFFTEYAGDGIGAKFVMLFVGIPLYICATSSTPLAWSLVAAGLSPGAALVMLLSGPATNIATMSWIIKDLGMRALVIYIGVIAAVALSAGILFDALLAQFVQIADAAELHNHASGFGIKEIAAILFIVLMAWALGMKMRAYLNVKGWGATHDQANAVAGGSCCSSKPESSSCGCSEA
ncbi:MAG: SO_0444 family Cu/Zn efflux transporter [bacterium]|nr:SO_0444 family Cu/Zn efflux transporter [bacterium]